VAGAPTGPPERFEPPHTRSARAEFTEEGFMPLIQVKLVEGVFTEVQKRQIVHRLTEAMVSVEGEAMRPVTWVTVEEVKSGDWGIGGKALTTADVVALRRLPPAPEPGRARDAAEA
jgi:4-oxalocrotonate tautomerase